MPARSDNHDSKAATASKIHSLAERMGITGRPADSSRKKSSIAPIITRAALFRREPSLRCSQHSAENRISLLALIRITPDTSDSYNRVQSGFYPASILYPSYRRAASSAVSRLRRTASTVVSVFLGATSPTSLRGTDKIDFSLTVRQRRHRRRRPQRRGRRRQRQRR